MINSRSSAARCYALLLFFCQLYHMAGISLCTLNANINASHCSYGIAHYAYYHHVHSSVIVHPNSDQLN